jgi:hypothetical protein
VLGEWLKVDLRALVRVRPLEDTLAFPAAMVDDGESLVHLQDRWQTVSISFRWSRKSMENLWEHQRRHLHSDFPVISGGGKHPWILRVPCYSIHATGIMALEGFYKCAVFLMPDVNSRIWKPSENHI